MNVHRSALAGVNYYLLPQRVEHCHDEDGNAVPPVQRLSKRGRKGGRPPSEWLRSLNAREIRVFLKTVFVRPVGIAGMTVVYHLTRHHSFRGGNLVGLLHDELMKLHSVAHAGY